MGDHEPSGSDEFMDVIRTLQTLRTLRMLQTLRDAAELTDITDVAGVTDVADVTNITDVAGVTDQQDSLGIFKVCQPRGDRAFRSFKFLQSVKYSCLGTLQNLL